MEKPVKGNVVVVPFPFSDLTSTKRRPALVVASLDGDDSVLCQITSETKEDKYTIRLQDSEFSHGKLAVPSRIRPNKLFTADKSLILYTVGSLKESKIREVEEKIIQIFKA